MVRPLVHHPDRQVLLCHRSQLLKSLDMVGLKLNREVRTGPSSGYPVSWNSFTPRPRESFALRIQEYVLENMNLSSPTLRRIAQA